MGTTTIKDYGRHSERHGDIAFFYAFPFRFYLGQHDVAPDDVMTWCRDNCQGYYRVTGYTHESSERKSKRSKEFTNKVVFADKVYLSDDRDAVMLKCAFDVRDTIIKRPRIKPVRAARRAKNVSVAK